MTVDGCLACAVEAGLVEAPGGLVAQTAHWAVDHCLGPYGVGAMVVRARGHVESVGELDDEAAAELGLVLRDVSRAQVEALGAARIYQALWVDQAPHHVHLVLCPRYPHDELRTVDLLAQRIQAGVPDAGEAARAAGLVRARLDAVRLRRSASVADLSAVRLAERVERFAPCPLRWAPAPHAIVMEPHDDEGIVAVVTAEHVELRLPTVEWTGGSYGPVATSRLHARVGAEAADDELRRALAEAHAARQAEIVPCCFCGERYGPEHRVDDACHSCATRERGVVY